MTKPEQCKQKTKNKNVLWSASCVVVVALPNKPGLVLNIVITGNFYHFK